MMQKPPLYRGFRYIEVSVISRDLKSRFNCIMRPTHIYPTVSRVYIKAAWYEVGYRKENTFLTLKIESYEKQYEK